MKLLAATFVHSLSLSGNTYLYVDRRQPVGQGRMSGMGLYQVGGWVVVEDGKACVCTPVGNVRWMVPECGVGEFLDSETRSPVSVSSEKNATPSLKTFPLSNPPKIDPPKIDPPKIDPPAPAELPGIPEVYKQTRNKK